MEYTLFQENAHYKQADNEEKMMSTNTRTTL